MKRFLTFMAVLLMVLYALSFGGRSDADRNLSQVGRALGLDLSAGTLLRFEDSHGGFHGDGLTRAEVELDGLSERLADAPGWRLLPMSQNTARVVGMFGAEGAEVKEGWYYLYDRHRESSSPYDDTDLCSRASWNFTAAVYDSRKGRLYFYKFDT